MSAPVTILIPNFNGEQLIEECVASAQRQSLLPRTILVVDDASTDHSPQLAAKLGATVFALPDNSGFARVVNLGVQQSTTDWVAIVNSDVVLAKDWLSRLLQAAQDAQAEFACGPITRQDQSDILDGGYDLLSRAACPWRAGNGFALSELRAPGDCWLPSFTALLIRRETFIQIGSLDEVFGSYLEDVDFALRLKSAGRRGVFVASALASHRGSATFGAWSPRATRLQSRNQVLLVARHYPDGWIRQFGRALLAGQLLWGALALRHGVFGPWLAGKVEGARLWSRVRRQTTQVEAKRLSLQLDECERTIRAWQGRNPRDAYWRWYFRLAGR